VAGVDPPHRQHHDRLVTLNRWGFFRGRLTFAQQVNIDFNQKYCED
jgi:hypothetical protein